jgi:hypothetical protein
MVSTFEQTFVYGVYLTVEGVFVGSNVNELCTLSNATRMLSQLTQNKMVDIDYMQLRKLTDVAST